MARPNPSPVGDIHPWGDRNEGWGDRDRSGPETDIQALMEAAPGCEPVPSKRETLARRDDVLDALAVLTERERYVVTSLVFEKVSQQKLATRMGLSRRMVRDILDKAMSKLRAELKPKGYGQ